jgi:hypothetical protein
MTSFRQIQANRQNAQRSTGPTSAAGKQKSRCNALRHGLTAETVIGQLEDAEDYQAFEAAIIADYDAQSAVERELVLRLASLLWRLRRATAMETGLFEIEVERLCSLKPVQRGRPQAADTIPNGPHDVIGGLTAVRQLTPMTVLKDDPDRKVDVTTCYLGLAELPTCPLDRLSRYEAILWRQAWQIMYALDSLGRPKPQAQSRFAFLRTRPLRPNEEY